MTGQELRDLRKSAGFTAGALASILGYRQQRWSAFENDRAPIPQVVEYAARWICENELVNNNRSLSAAERAVNVLLRQLNPTGPIIINCDGDKVLF